MGFLLCQSYQGVTCHNVVTVTTLQANNLLIDCIEEIPKYLAKLHSTPETFCSEVEGAKEYDVKLERKKQQHPEKHGNHTWRDDRIEATRRHGSGGVVTARILPTCL
eukprot:scaffold3165_cov137-Skeletonema_menzelii.AAC.1